MSPSLIFFSAISGAALLCYAVLLVITVRNGLRQRAHRYFALYLGGMMVWSLGALMMYLDPGDAEYWNKVMMSGVAFTPLAFYGFVQGFLGRSNRDPFIIPGTVVLLIALVQNANGALVADISVAQTGLILFAFGPAMPLFGAYFLFFQFLAAYNLVHDFRQTTDFALRNRIQYILLGWVLIMVGGVTNILPIAGALPFDIAANLVNALLITYAISRYHLLDLTLIVRKGLVYSMTTGFVVIGYLLIVFLGVDLLELVSGARFLMALVVALLVAGLLQPGRDRIQAWVDRLFFRERYDAAVMLQRLSRQVASVLDLRQLAELILDEITNTMQVSKVMLIIRDRETGSYAPLAERGFDESLTLRFKPDSPIINWLANQNDVLTAGDLALQPQFKGLWANERADLAATRIELFIGSRVGGELVGMLALGPKRSEAPYTPDEQRTLETLANQTAVAVQNAWLYGAALEETERAQTILQAAFAGMIVVDRSLHIIAMNPSAETLTGHEISDLRNKPLTTVFGPDLAGTSDALSRVVQTGRPLAPVEVTFNNNGQRLDLLLGVTPLRDGYLVNFADITRQKEVERLKSDIVANVSHELRSPLASIKGYTELLMEDMDREDPALRQKFLAVINEETDRLSVFIDEMLNLARLEAGHIALDLTPVPMGVLVTDAARSLKLQADAADVAIRLDIPVDLPTVLVDMSWIYSALRNLISNAIKFSPRGAAVEVIASQTESTAVIEVIDHGPGIAPQDLPHLFTKFYRGSTARQLGVSGSGLGLVLAKQAIESHQGTIVVESGESSGARFVVTLPIASPSMVQHQVG
jgi:PAS domain S-box-containing protein